MTVSCCGRRPLSASCYEQSRSSCYPDRFEGTVATPWRILAVPVKHPLLGQHRGVLRDPNLFAALGAPTLGQTAPQVREFSGFGALFVLFNSFLVQCSELLRKKVKLHRRNFQEIGARVAVKPIRGALSRLLC